ncbi:hypothetical protein [Neisseria shayeganii]|uniref:Lipoprotein n=1 Tax=Neisseria shayeganii TaxID=607712 RepID=A0A7D7NH11_9NEIS|nr:hypothetical protein [Neisseria shayeganii]QMT41234.1 hypothetical protein H3L94_04190 [Neisseria shayeganii]
MKAILILSGILALSGCAMTYKAPVTADKPYSADLNADKAAIMAAAKVVLVNEGYTITSADDNAGVISTSPHDMRLKPEQADCGTTLGIDYLKDNRTTTSVALGLVVTDGNVLVKSKIQGHYIPQATMLSCVSRGSIEQDFLQKLKQRLGQ